MPHAPVNGIELYYEVHGGGPNLVLIEGLGFHTWMWYRQVPGFAPHFRTLMYDNRGAGRSSMPPGPYSHAQNAADLAALLDFLGWERTHVLGISMGGFIAQEFALRYPDRLDRLVLVATGFGGPNMIPVPAEAVRYLVANPAEPLETRVRAAAPIVFGNPAWPDEHPDEFDQILRRRAEHPQTPEANMAQIMAAATFNTEERLQEIEAPTLIMAGTLDRVVPPRNAELLTAKIPHARLDLIPGAGHHLFYEFADRFNADVIAFLQGDV